MISRHVWRSQVGPDHRGPGPGQGLHHSISGFVRGREWLASDMVGSAPECENSSKDNNWRSTVSQEYDHDGNHRIEQRNRRLRDSVRTILYDMTGGRLQYQELGPMVKRIASKLRNHIPMAGDKTPVQKAGGKPIDVIKHAYLSLIHI